MGTSKLHRRAMDHYTAIWWLVHLPLMGGLLRLVQLGGAWASCGHAQSSDRPTYSVFLNLFTYLLIDNFILFYVAL